MKTVVITIFLILSTLLDLRKKEVNISLCVGVALLGLIYEIFISKAELLSVILGIIPGIFLILTSMATNEEIGKGDAAILCTIGIYLGLKKSTPEIFESSRFNSFIIFLLISLKLFSLFKCRYSLAFDASKLAFSVSLFTKLALLRALSSVVLLFSFV